MKHLVYVYLPEIHAHTLGLLEMHEKRLFAGFPDDALVFKSVTEYEFGGNLDSTFPWDWRYRFLCVRGL